jgi:hypothetical protein
MAQNMEHQNLDRELKADRDMEGIAGTAETVWEKTAAEMETAWEKVAVRKKTEMETTKKMVQAERTIAKMEKRMVETEMAVEATQKTAAVNEKTEWESLYQNRHNTCQTDGRMSLYNLKMKSRNRNLYTSDHFGIKRK